MRSRPLFIGLAALALASAPVTLDLRSALVTAPTAAAAIGDVSVNLFFTALEPYGAWVPNSDYNFVWVPTSVDRTWSPYTRGHWTYTDRFGWYFVSDEPFAWAVYHYGRWGYDPDLGWYWVPGTHFAGAWVAWRQGDAVVGWAPLPPEGRGYSVNINVGIAVGDVPQNYWRFVQARDFLAPQLIVVFIAGDRQPAVFQQSKPAGNVTVQNNVVINNVINLTFIEQQTNQKVTVAKVATVTDPKDATPAKDTATSITAFVADLGQPDATIKPAKVTEKTALQAPTKGQGQAPAIPDQKPAPTLGALPNAPGPAQAGTANPACTDATFAKANPKDCPAPANAAAIPNAGGTPATGGAGPTPAPTGTAAIPGNGGNPANARCLDATFAKANPKDCAAPANAAATPNAGGAPATAAVPPIVATPPAKATGGAAVQGNANVNAADARCADATFAKNNPKTCADQGTNPAGKVTAPAAAAVITPPAAPAPGSVSVQGNAALADARCVDVAFAKANPKTCAVSGNATGQAITPPAPAQK